MTPHNFTDGLSQDLAHWLRTQGDWYCLLLSKKREVIFVIRDNISISVEDISISEFVRYKARELWNDIVFEAKYLYRSWKARIFAEPAADWLPPTIEPMTETKQSASGIESKDSNSQQEEVVEGPQRPKHRGKDLPSEFATWMWEHKEPVTLFKNPDGWIYYIVGSWPWDLFRGWLEMSPGIVETLQEEDETDDSHFAKIIEIYFPEAKQQSNKKSDNSS